jgi:hypothetical protein
MAHPMLGVVGLGAFGGAVAARVAREGFPLMVSKSPVDRCSTSS